MLVRRRLIDSVFITSIAGCTVAVGKLAVLLGFAVIAVPYKHRSSISAPVKYIVRHICFDLVEVCIDVYKFHTMTPPQKSRRSSRDMLSVSFLVSVMVIGFAAPLSPLRSMFIVYHIFAVEK